MMPSYPASDLATYNRLWNYNYMQRLDTVAGVPLDSCNSSSVGTINEAAYECDYVLAFQSVCFLSLLSFPLSPPTPGFLLSCSYPHIFLSTFFLKL